MKVTPLRSREIFGNPLPPKVVYEQQFDGADKELAKFGRKDWQDITEGDLWYYIHDLAYMKLQPDLFAHLFPICLNFWHATLMRGEDASRGDADFHYALRQGEILRKILTPQQREGVYEFFHDGFIERLQAERDFVYSGNSTSCYRWMSRFNSIGLVAPIIGKIWNSWWNFDHPGKAVCAVMWASGLVYDNGANPIFGSWMGDKGGGGPYLTSHDSNIYDAGWLENNLRFLREQLSVEYIQAKLTQAAEALQGEPEFSVAAQIANDAKSQADFIEYRILELMDGLADTELDQFEIW